ncbi:MAG: YciI family protein [Gammaproteobacteria bacterium]|uniref:YciI family protein n=1 Tax=Limnobacter sp. TaxID=2003368 RepID=UPI001D86A55B|nr:YciI family protein [Limnobacter sp.]MBU0785021.1 YciI family protein [Gammaproteobacteria bacterium]MBU0849059.1 YciI family protein [Gammaproteobacteria bacterium]MBU1266648.1 YciI family protein [Gammaproteobacteria bacterium]MBU1529885.1 YciI family protein [Gammaproteobacteria bacterium]MBU1781396.1 YciI family protein [Gammaproteobacteria bacterium]
MKYLCLAHEEEGLFKAMPHEQWLALRQETLDYVQSLKASGHLIATHALQSARHGVLVRVRNHDLVTSDGPFAETKEQLGGIFLIEAHDFNEALRIASRWPSARLGTIEVRPVEETLRKKNRYGD